MVMSLGGALLDLNDVTKRHFKGGAHSHDFY